MLSIESRTVVLKHTNYRMFVYRLVPQTLLLAVLLASLTLVPAAVYLGLSAHDLVAVLINLR